MLALLSSDESLNHLWLSQREQSPPELETSFVVYTEPHELLTAVERGGGIDYAVLSDRYFDYGAFCEYTEALRERQPSLKLSVMLSDRHDRLVNERWMKTCLANGFNWISPHRTRDMILQQLAEHRGAVRSADMGSGSKMLVFIGSTPNIGTTLTAFGTALRLAHETIHRIGYICLNLKSSKLHRYIGNDKPAFTLDQLRAELRSRSLTSERLQKACESIRGNPNLHVLYGNMLREQSEYFMPEDIEFLLRVARGAFELVIVEVGAYWDNAATLCSLLGADGRYWVTTKEIAHFQEDTNRWLFNLGSTFGIAPSSFDLIVTQTDKQEGSGQLSLKDVRLETGMQLVGQIHRYPYVGSLLNQGKLLELLTGRQPIRQELARIADGVIRYHQLTRKPEPVPEASTVRKWMAGMNSLRLRGKATKWEA
ncbi:hypothetical protein [Paenibacillus koleovorans]|uniref:hypothetical protein n=1 Tax=Paenibacillus koleovorans TaxID=121608 RepID=UPI000FD8C626|nr:hypothetical protein [Paenibacillus koleovorans]